MFHFLKASEKIKDLMAKTRANPRRRIQFVYDLAKSKTICEGGDSMEKNFDSTVNGEDLEKVSS